MRHRLGWALVAAAVAMMRLPAADGPSGPAWERIRELFRPPPDAAGGPGAPPCPLVRRDGQPVRTAAEWGQRRAEVLSDWKRFLGPWPPLLERPAVEVLQVTNRLGIRHERLRMEIAPGQQGEAWLLVPPGRGPFPAVLVVYYEPETSVGLNPKQPGRDFGLQLAGRGFVTLSLGTPGGNAWKPDLGQSRCQPLAFHAYVAANAWQVLAARPEVDSRRIGVTGHSYGGKWAMFAGAFWEKFAAVAVSDPGIVFDEKRPNVNYWEPWYLGADPVEKRPRAGVPSADNPRTGAYRRLMEAGRDLHEVHALIAPRPFFVSGGSEDPPERWNDLRCAVEVNARLGKAHRVGMSNRAGHDPTPESNAQLLDFFTAFLQPREP